MKIRNGSTKLVQMDLVRKQACASLFSLLLLLGNCDSALAYAFNLVVPDMRQPSSVSGGSACPVKSRQLAAAGNLALRWSTALGASPQTIFTQNTTSAGQINEIAQTISTALAVWTGVNSTALTPASLAPLSQVSTASACGADGLNSLCFNQPDMAFTPGVLAFTRVVTADRIGEQLGSSAVSGAPGQILDADIYFNPGDSTVTFATPAALASHPKSYDLESILTHELGHFLGFSHSAVWGAMMFPYAHAPGTFATPRPTAAKPDAPLADDDRTGLRVLYPDPSDLLHTGSVAGHITPANPISLPVSPPGVTGIFGSQVVAVDSSTGDVVGATLGGWSCADPGPAQFDGGYKIEKLPVGHSYIVYAEPLDGAVDPSQVSNALQTVCRNTSTDAGWPPQFSCVVPAVNAEFTARARPAP